MLEQTDTTESKQRNANVFHTWRPLLFLNLYRLIVASLFVSIGLYSEQSRVLGDHNPQLFSIVSIIYLIISLIAFISERRRKPAFTTQVSVHILLDIFCITLMMHASGGVTSGLGMLIVVAIASGSILITEQNTVLFAAIATITLLLEQFYSHFENMIPSPSYAHAGFLGATFFATAAAAHILAKRIRDSEALAEKRGVDLANMEQLTQYVIQRMQTGIMVVDEQERIRLINESAWYLLKMAPRQQQTALTDISPELGTQLVAWQNNLLQTPHIFRPTSSAAEIMPRFARLGSDNASGTLIFLEDTTAMAQQAQQLKLASLGRLTASIAHEIRNPLGAISHAGQLLSESSQLNDSEKRMTEIIADQSQRVNSIIENILQLSRREKSRPADFLLEPWLCNFLDEFCRDQRIDRRAIRLDIHPTDIKVRFDPSQLHQVIWNLCHNGMRHTQSRPGQPSLLLTCGIPEDSHQACLSVIDFGPGVPLDVSEQIFEPFFTTESKGTGLGLYIARELCECNQARLTYATQTSGGGCFRVTFADSRRVQVV